MGQKRSRCLISYISNALISLQKLRYPSTTRKKKAQHERILTGGLVERKFWPDGLLIRGSDEEVYDRGRLLIGHRELSFRELSFRLLTTNLRDWAGICSAPLPSIHRYVYATTVLLFTRRRVCFEDFARWRYQSDVRQGCLVDFVRMAEPSPISSCCWNCSLNSTIFENWESPKCRTLY